MQCMKKSCCTRKVIGIHKKTVLCSKVNSVAPRFDENKQDTFQISKYRIIDIRRMSEHIGYSDYADSEHRTGIKR